jgi:hypothetical protein
VSNHVRRRVPYNERRKCQCLRVRFSKERRCPRRTGLGEGVGSVVNNDGGLGYYKWRGSMGLYTTEPAMTVVSVQSTMIKMPADEK